MTNVGSQAAQVFRDYEVGTTTPHQPVPAEIRQLFASIDTAFDAASASSGSALAAAVSAEAQARSSGDAAVAAAIASGDASEAAARLAFDLALPIPFPLHHRPGDATINFANDLYPSTPLDAALLASGPEGAVARIAQSARRIASRWLFAVEPGRTYAAIFAVRRVANTSDPDNDAVRMALAWYGATKARSTQADTVVSDNLGLLVSSGRRVVATTVTDADGGGQIKAPAGARYVCPYVQTYGVVATTDVEIIGWRDITDAAAYSPDLTALSGRVGALESLALGARVTTLESAASGPNVMTFETIADFQAASIPASVNVVNALSGAAFGDGGGLLFKRDAAGAYMSHDGAKWSPFYSLRAMLNQLPTSTDGAAPAAVPSGGHYWNGNFLCRKD